MSTGDQALGDYHRGNSEAGPQQMSGHNSNVGNSQSLWGQHHHQQPLKFLPPPASTPSFTELLQDSASSVNSHVSFRASSDVAEQLYTPKRKAKNKRHLVLPLSCGLILRALCFIASAGSGAFMNQKLRQERSIWGLKIIGNSFLCFLLLPFFPCPLSVWE